MTTPSVAIVTERFRHARRDRDLALLEGFHTLKHALRFGAHLLELATSDAERPAALAALLAPDVADALRALPLAVIPEAELRKLCSVPRGEPIVAIARRRAAEPENVLRAPGRAPIVFLEAPSSLSNAGAVVRVAAAAGAAAVITSGVHDPWHPAALRGAAGLHFALPVGRVDGLDWLDGRQHHGRPLVAVHPDGPTLPLADWPDRAILAFGSERNGLSDALLERADARISIPMRAGVSSLSLATAVAVTLYARGNHAPLTVPSPAPRDGP